MRVDRGRYCSSYACAGRMRSMPDTRVAVLPVLYSHQALRSPLCALAQLGQLSLYALHRSTQLLNRVVARPGSVQASGRWFDPPHQVAEKEIWHKCLEGQLKLVMTNCLMRSEYSPRLTKNQLGLKDITLTQNCRKEAVAMHTTSIFIMRLP